MPLYDHDAEVDGQADDDRRHPEEDVDEEADGIGHPRQEAAGLADLGGEERRQQAERAPRTGSRAPS